MDIRNIAQEDIANMSQEEKREYARELIKEAKQDKVKLNLIGPNGQAVDLVDLCNKAGDDDAVEFLTKLMECNVASCQVTKDEYDEIIAKMEAGEKLTEEEQRKFDMVDTVMREKYEATLDMFYDNTVFSVLNLLQHTQEECKCDISVHDFMSCYAVVFASIFTTLDGTRASLYRTDFESLVSIGEKIATELEEAWNATHKEPVSPDLLAIGALYFFNLQTAKMHYPIPNHKELFEALSGTPIEETEEENSQEESE